MVQHGRPQPATPSLSVPSGRSTQPQPLTVWEGRSAPRPSLGPRMCASTALPAEIVVWLLQIFEIFYSGNFNFSKLKQMSGNTSLKSGWTSCPWGLGPKWAGSALAVGPPPAVPPACLQPVGGQACFLCIWGGDPGLAPTLSGQRACVCQTVGQFASVPAGAHHPPVHPLWGVTDRSPEPGWPHTALARQSVPMRIVSRSGRLCTTCPCSLSGPHLLVYVDSVSNQIR